MRLLASCLVALLATAVPAAQKPLTAEQIARNVQDRDTGRDSRFTMRMKLADRHNRLRERMLDVITLRDRKSVV